MGDPDPLDPAYQAGPIQQRILRMLLYAVPYWHEIDTQTDVDEAATRELATAGWIEVVELSRQHVHARLTRDGAYWRGVLRGNEAGSVKTQGAVLSALRTVEDSIIASQGDIALAIGHKGKHISGLIKKLESDGRIYPARRVGKGRATKWYVRFKDKAEHRRMLRKLMGSPDES